MTPDDRKHVHDRLRKRAVEEGDHGALMFLDDVDAMAFQWDVSPSSAALRVGNYTIIHLFRTKANRWLRPFGGTYLNLNRVTDAMGIPRVANQEQPNE